ncbi:Cysteine-rich receptor-like protein kinase 8 [Linum perenne]
MLLQFGYLITAEGDDPFVFCGTNGNYTSGSTYQQNLNLTLSSLVANVSLTGYYTTSNGEIPEAAYGLIQCRAYLSRDGCQSCVDKVVSAAIRLCPYQRKVTRFSGECSLQYADWSFFAEGETSPVMMKVTYGGGKPENQSRFSSQLVSLIQDLSLQARDDPYRLATGNISYLSFRPIFAMVECVRDLSGDDCFNCLQSLLKPIPFDEEAAQVSAISCNARYGTTKFFRSSPLPSSLSPPWSPPPSPPPPLLSPPSPPPRSATSHGNLRKNSKRIVTLVIIPVLASVAVVVLISAVIYLFLHARASSINPDGGEIRGKSFLFSLDALKTATMDFDSENKLGEGGFGPVYKGNLPDGQDIAVKRLSTSSKLNPEDLRTEVMLIAKLMHKNLVRLLGFCFEEEEKMLVYEYLPNGSLDEILHDPNRRFDLDWGTRYKIITGIARGMLYLHEDSQLTIIHRGLKSSNILLDASMTPKIADFGLARVFLGSEGTQIAETKVEISGYMAPEYAENGQFSVKSDVYSFGILLLEIVTGQRSSETRDSVNLQSDVWDHWSNGMALNLRDPTMGDRFANTEVLKCIHIGLLCVQESVAVRPTMSEVVMMLSSHTVTYPTPLKPGFFVNR